MNNKKTKLALALVIFLSLLLVNTNSAQASFFSSTAGFFNKVVEGIQKISIDLSKIFANEEENCDGWDGIKRFDGMTYCESINKLTARASKSIVNPGESYKFYFQGISSSSVNYNGQLDYSLNFCPADDLSNCVQSSGHWGFEAVNGVAVTLVPPNIPPGAYKTRFRPKDSNSEWSNEVQVNVGTNYGLEDTKDYWKMPAATVLFKGINNVYKKDFKTVIGYTPETLCGENG